MRQSASYVVAIALAAASCRIGVQPTTFSSWLYGLKIILGLTSFDIPTFSPIETFVDWLEASYGGPIDCGKRRS